MEKRTYAAFISYRHAPLDTAVAERLHRTLEHYVIPKEQRRNGEKHLGLIFRDRDELPLSSDLTRDIYEALDNSEYLIVVCSPETPKSKWVAREIEYFTSLHGHQRVLTVLAAGTPEESIPEQVTRIRQEDGSVREVEPLCAFIVAQDQRHVLRNLDKEKLRLMAAMLQCPYDTMVQREKRYRQRRISMALGVAALVVLCFAAVMLRNYLQVQELNRRIEAQLLKTQLSESKALASISGQQLAEGDRTGAIVSALAGLPSGAQERPVVAEAEQALLNALYAYEDTRMRMVSRTEHNENVYDMALSPDGAFAATMFENGRVNGIDAKFGTVLWSAQAFLVDYDAPGALNLIVRDFEVTGNGTVLCVSAEGAVALSAEDGSERFRISFLPYDEMMEMGLSEDGSRMAVLMRGSLGNGVYEYDLAIYDMADGREISRTGALGLPGEISVTNIGAYGYNERRSFSNAALLFSEDGGTLRAVLASRDPDAALTILTVDAASGKVLASDVHEGWPGGSVSFVQAIALDGGELLIYWRETGRLESGRSARADHLVRLSAEHEVVYDQSRILSFGTVSVAEEEPVIVVTETRAFCVHSDSVLIFDLEKGSLVVELEPSEKVLTAMAAPGRDRLALVAADGSVSCMGADGTLESANQDGFDDCGFALSAAKAFGGGLCVVPRNMGDTMVLLSSCRDEHGQTVFESPEESEDDANSVYYDSHLYYFPSGDKLLVQEVTRITPPEGEYEEGMEGDWFINTFTTYDAETLEMLDRFSVTDVGGFYLYMIGRYYLDGFSADESKLYFSERYVLDLEAHDIYELEAGWKQLEFSYPMAELPPSHQQPGESSLIVQFKGEKLTWLEDGKAYSANSPWVPDDYGVRYHPIYVGGSGLTVVPGYMRDETTASAAMKLVYYMIYSIREDRWTRLNNPCTIETHLEPALCVGDSHPWVAIADSDGMLRIYDQQSDSVIREFPLDLFTYNIDSMVFVMDDSVLLIQMNPNILLAVDAVSGEVLGRYHLEGTWPTLAYWVDEAGGMLYVCSSHMRMTGLCIDLSDWSVRFTVPSMMGYLPASNSVLRRDDSGQLLLRYPVYDTRELIQWGEEVLSGQ